MRRLALVVQRYGKEVGGGAETHAREVATRLTADLDVTVLTTCALEYRTWADHYPAGESHVDGVRVLRFPVPEPRRIVDFDQLSREAFARPHDLALGKQWLAAQGPNAPGLLAHLRARGSTYDAVAFITYLYATTVNGIGIVSERALLVPAMHDEPPLRLQLYDEVLADAQVLLFSTPEERELARERFGLRDERARIVGVGIDEPPQADPERFRAATGVRRPYALCLGRLDLSKGVGELVHHHAVYRQARPEGLDLVLAGAGEVDLPSHPWLYRTGFLDEEGKHAALAGATVVINPSPYESLSLAQLEAWSHGRPTLVSAVSPVLVGQSRRAAGGLWYENVEEYAVMLDLLATSPPLAYAIGRQGRRYVQAAYDWNRVRRAWLEAIETVAASSI